MDVRSPRPLPASPPARQLLVGGRWALGMATSLVAVGLITLTPRGGGWAWGSPLDEARWYLTGLDSPATMAQLTGNLLLLVVPFGLAAWRWPTLGHLGLLTSSSLAASSTLEFWQWALPLGRVVSPVAAVLNATGALAAGLVVAHVRAVRSLLPRQYATNPSGDDDEYARSSRRWVHEY